jgi:poly(hydroxyalkanoate) granule-associated protein
MELKMATTVKPQVIEVEYIDEENTNNALTRIQELGRKSVHAYLGMWRTIYDGAKNTVNRGTHLFGDAVDRGEDIEKQAMENAKEITSQAEERANKMQERVTRTFDRSKDEMSSQIESALTRLDIPSRANIAEINAKLDALDNKLNQIMAMRAEAVVELPMPGYDKLNVKEITSKLAPLTFEELVAVKQFELAHENRVTVLREVDRRLTAMPIARYDALTVDEIEPLLTTLDIVQLENVAEYEAAHENRVTLLRAIESEVKAHKTAVA